MIGLILVFCFFFVDVEGSPLASSTHMGLEMKNPRCETYFFLGGITGNHTEQNKVSFAVSHSNNMFLLIS